jgi:hypothetical protein
VVWDEEQFMEMTPTSVVWDEEISSDPDTNGEGLQQVVISAGYSVEKLCSAVEEQFDTPDDRQARIGNFPVLDDMSLVDVIWDEEPDLDSHDGLLRQLAQGQEFIGEPGNHFDEEPIDEGPVFDKQPLIDIASSNFNNEMLGLECPDEQLSEESEPVGPLHDAARKGGLDTYKYMVENLGFDIVSVATNGSGLTSMACAVSHGIEIAARYSISKGAALSKQDHKCLAHLHYAAVIKLSNIALRLCLADACLMDKEYEMYILFKQWDPGIQNHGLNEASHDSALAEFQERQQIQNEQRLVCNTWSWHDVVWGQATFRRGGNVTYGPSPRPRPIRMSFTRRDRAREMATKNRKQKQSSSSSLVRRRSGASSMSSRPGSPPTATGCFTLVLEALDRVVGIKGMTGEARVPVVAMGVHDSKMEGVAISLVLWEEVVMGVDAW